MVSEVAEPPAGAFRRQLPFDQILAITREPQEMQIDLVPLPAHDVRLRPRSRRRTVGPVVIGQGVDGVAPQLGPDLQIGLRVRTMGRP